MRLLEMFNLDESFDTIPELKWDGYDASDTYGGSYDAKFLVDNIKYLVTFNEGDEHAFTDNVWSISFRQVNSSFKPTGNMGQSAIVVMGGVVEAIRQFTQDHKPVAMGLLGKDSIGLGNLYRIMAGKLRAEMSARGFSVHVGTYNGSTMILLYPTGGEPSAFLNPLAAA